MKIEISHKAEHRLNSVYGWRALLCGTGFHSYRRQACWTEGTSWWQHECKYCGHVEWFWVKGGKKMGEEMFLKLPQKPTPVSKPNDSTTVNP
jgi:hypothetical protein